MNNNQFCVIMAGGVGSRFWPISRHSRPKQFLDVLGTGKSLLRATFERFANIIPVGNILVATNTAYRDMVLEEIPEIAPSQVLCEPVGRNTAPCVAYAAMHIRSLNPAATMVVSPSDHLILNEHHFCEVIQQCLDFIDEKPDTLLTIGLEPTRPETGYGYIQVSKKVTHGKFNKVKTFTEKPNAELAKVFVDSGEYFWNSGIFAWSVNTILEAFKEHQSETYEILDSIREAYGTPDEQAAIDRVYPECGGISVDYGIMERSSNVWVRCSDFGWSDLGTWGSIYQHSTKDEQGNTLRMGTFTFDTENCIVKLPSGKIAVLEGLKDYIVVDTEDVLMVCPRKAEQHIKRFIENVKFETGEKHI
jgi:mannose-1-phosphate guanylyltransferase